MELTDQRVARRRPTVIGLDSPVQGQAHNAGGGVTTSKTLDVIEQLLKAARHPDITKISRYGPGDGPWGPSVNSPGMKDRRVTGLKVTHQSTATASLWEAVLPGEQPVDTPAALPAPKANRAPRLVILAAALLDAARPPQFKAWRLVTVPGIGRPETQAGLPFGLSIVHADGTRMLLRATATGPTVGDEPDEDPFPGWTAP